MSEDNKVVIDPSDLKGSLTKYSEVLLERATSEFKASDESNKKSIEDFKSEINKELEEWKEKTLKDHQDRKVGFGDGLKEEMEAHEKKTGFKFHLSKVVKAQLEGSWDNIEDSGFEREIIEQYALKKGSNNAQTGEAGGFLIPEEVKSEIIDLAIAQTPTLEMGPTILRGLRGELPIPKVTSRPTMYWVGEEEAPPESRIGLGEITLRPKTAAALAKISKRLIYQSSGVAEKLLRDELVKSFAIGLEDAYLNSPGSEKRIKGVRFFDGLTASEALGTDGERFKIDDAAEMSMNIDVANMLKGNLGYIMRPEVLSGMLRERVDQYSAQDFGEGQPVSSVGIMLSRAELEAALNGWKIRTTTILPNDIAKGTSTTLSPVIFGDWSQYIIGMWEDFEMVSSMTAGDASGSAFTQRQVWINAFQGIDTNMKDATGFTVVSDAETLKSKW